MLTEIIQMAIIFALVSAFIILFIGRVGLRDMIAEKSRSIIISDLIQCDFCLSFWLAAVQGIVISIIFKDFSFMCCVFLSTPITRFIL